VWRWFGAECSSTFARAMLVSQAGLVRFGIDMGLDVLVVVEDDIRSSGTCMIAY
jgi:hypothetical protein